MCCIRLQTLPMHACSDDRAGMHSFAAVTPCWHSHALYASLRGCNGRQVRPASASLRCRQVLPLTGPLCVHASLLPCSRRCCCCCNHNTTTAAASGAKTGNIEAPVANNPAVYGINTAVLALAAGLAATNPQLVSSITTTWEQRRGCWLHSCTVQNKHGFKCRNVAKQSAAVQLVPVVICVGADNQRNAHPKNLMVVFGRALAGAGNQVQGR